MNFLVQKLENGVRRGTLKIGDWEVKTPFFMPVATRASVRGLRMDDVEKIGFELLLSNTYHLFRSPGVETVEKLGGFRKMTGWKRPVLTDSGGYQFFSLRKFAKFTPDGVKFRDPDSGERTLFTPEKIVEIQLRLGSDILMPLDWCVEYPATEKKALGAVIRTTEWAERSLAAFKKLKDEIPSPDGAPRALFGIVQGSTFDWLREKSLEEITSMDFDGFAIGGVSVGEPQEEMRRIVEQYVHKLPEDKPRYLMGVGFPEDIEHGLRHGVDMFDCVLPTRLARHATVFTSEGRLNLKNSRFRTDERPLDANCPCPACKFSRAYLSHLIRQNELLGMTLLTEHNLIHYSNILKQRAYN